MDARPSYQPRCDFPRFFSVGSRQLSVGSYPTRSTERKGLARPSSHCPLFANLSSWKDYFCRIAFSPSAIAVFVGISLVTRLDPDREFAARRWSISTIWKSICKAYCRRNFVSDSCVFARNRSRPCPRWTPPASLLRLIVVRSKMTFGQNPHVMNFLTLVNDLY